MNPLLSLSFLSSGAVSAGAEPVVNEVGQAMDDSGAADKFGRLLDQSGEQQQATDRQSFAGFSFVNKTKQRVSMEGQPTGKPEISLPPVIPPEAELSLADDNKAGALLGLLDLASQTRLQLRSQADKNGQAGANTDSTHSADATDATADNALSAINDGKKLTKGEWFILPVFPELAQANSAGSGSVAAEGASGPDKPVAGNAASDNKASENKVAVLAASAAKISEQSANSAELAVDSAALNNPENARNNATATNTLAQQALANQAAVTELAAAAQAQNKPAEGVKAATASSKIAAEAGVTQDTAASDTDGAAESELSAQPDSNKLATSGQAAASQPSSVQADAAHSAQPRAGENHNHVTPEQPVEPETTAGLTAATSLLTKPASDSANQQPLNQTSTSADGVGHSEITNVTPASSGVTIFDKSAQQSSATADDAALASSLAGAATVADSALARQQRAGTADSASQGKQALTAGSEPGEPDNKTEAGFVPGAQRAELSASSFGSVFGQASQSQGEAIAARLDAAAIAGSQQTTERAKTQSVHKSVTEQLKQVNLLAQNAAGQLKERINLMVRQNIQVAEIRLDPAELGQMQIRVNLQQEQATVQFIVQQQHAKELLEQQMPRLREMLQQQGIQLGEGQVQQQRQGDSQASGQRSGNTGNGQGGGEQHAEEHATAVQLDVKLSERLVDYYA